MLLQLKSTGKLTLFLTLLLGCSGRPVSKTQALALHPLESDDGLLVSQVLSSGPIEVNQHKDYYHFQIPTINQVELDCYFYTQRLDPAMTMDKLSRNLPDLDKRIVSQNVLTPTAGQLEGHPFLNANHILMLEDKKDFFPHQAYMVTFPQNSLYCFTTLPFLHRSFEAVLSSFIKNLTPSFQTKGALYREVSTLSVGKVHFGVVESTVTQTTLGPWMATSLVSSLGLVHPAYLEGSDLVIREMYDSKGNLLGGRYFLGESLLPIFQLELKRLDNLSYLVRGKYYGKDLSTTFKSKSPLKHHLYFNKKQDKVKSELLFLPQFSVTQGLKAEVSSVKKQSFKQSLLNFKSHYQFKEQILTQIETLIDGSKLLQKVRSIQGRLP